MNKTALWALIIALFIPFIGFLLVKDFSKNAVHMPRRYFYDSVAVVEKAGKRTTDTLWHSVKNISFINQNGKPVSLNDARGKIIVLNFFFTRCPTICPGLTVNMKRLQQSYVKNDSIVQFISISVDPENDSVPQLRHFANRFNANQDNWWFVTGNKKEIYDFALTEMKASVADTDVDTAFIHTENFFLLDSSRVVRGWYNGFDTVQLAQLARDIPILMLEKGKNSPSFFRNFIPILPIIIFGIVAAIAITIFISKRKPRE
ncbi:MAG TPA: SCO family protein [Ferruginibacter sp.]|nr:SCO family protein [Bacteroidota bacterium]MCC6691762.1 SCO family protein [Chitinophagaceae bacterium]HMT95602.1 SCO family protein [Ferruginibacter sp.]MBS1926739.1 SCO family protein [Bacteroidota bacterium]HMU24806.1 SCO family protein [Ferruginibacter sp.]